MGAGVVEKRTRELVIGDEKKKMFGTRGKIGKKKDWENMEIGVLQRNAWEVNVLFFPFCFSPFGIDIGKGGGFSLSKK